MFRDSTARWEKFTTAMDDMAVHYKPGAVPTPSKPIKTSEYVSVSRFSLMLRKLGRTFVPTLVAQEPIGFHNVASVSVAPSGAHHEVTLVEPEIIPIVKPVHPDSGKTYYISDFNPDAGVSETRPASWDIQDRLEAERRTYISNQQQS